MAVSVEVSEEEGVRYLHFGSRWVQGAMRIARPFALELDYTRDMMLPLLLRWTAGWPKQVLLIGLGAASLTRFLQRHRPQAVQTVIEIEPAVIAAARQFFKLGDEGPNLSIVVADGADYLVRCQHRFDLIFVDGFDAKGGAGRLDTLPFYLDCRAHLADAGLLSVNLLRRTRGVKPSVARMSEAFDGRVKSLPECPGGNTVTLGGVGEVVELAYADLRDRAGRLRDATGLNLLPTIVRMKAADRGAPFRL